MVWFVWIGCSGTGTDGAPPTDASADAPSPGTTGDTGTVPTEDTGAPPETTEACDPSPTLQVQDVTVATPWTSHEVEVSVTLSEAASVAVACTLRSDPTEVHLVEEDVPGTDATLRISGLLANETYDCVANAVCPRTLDGATVFTHETGPDPMFLPEIATQTFDPAAGDEYLLANASLDCWWPDGQLIVADREGRIRWWMPTPAWVGPSIEFRYHGDELFAWGGGWGPNSSARPRLVDLYDGEIYDSADAMPDVGTSAYHHDGKLLADGRMLTLEEVEVQAPGWTFDGFQVRRIDPATNTVDFTYHSQRAFDEGHLPSGFGDTWHANWVDIVEIDGDDVLVVSLCNLGWTVGIDVATGDWRWTFGADGDFALEDAAGSDLPASEFPQCQHGLELEPPTLLVYDNGTNRGYSRATQYTLDEGTLTATLDWTWTEPDWHETTLGDVDYMPSGHIWIGMGHAECFSSNPGDRSTVVELDPVTGTKLWEAAYTEANMSLYRADSADPCALFANAAVCDEVTARLGALTSELTP